MVECHVNFTRDFTITLKDGTEALILASTSEARLNLTQVPVRKAPVVQRKPKRRRHGTNIIQRNGKKSGQRRITRRKTPKV